MSDQPARITFAGRREAEFFCLEAKESPAGALSQNCATDEPRGGPGFVFASVEDRPWHDTMWTRDTGVFL